ncbi:pseudouridine synthase [Occallatibacter riparius]|uniref:pseudouridine synthase n=1 Tax=Occallatibacter riparius TaxID=1002689 RepID=UPI0021B4CFAD|nr:pseudouridine synthase [Occallatibacter riparius]
MPRKSKKNTESELFETQANETEPAQSAQEGAVPEAESDLPVKKTARKKRAAKAAPAEAVTVIQEADAVAPEVEAKAQAEDTFDAAFEANDATERSTPEAVAQPAAKAEKPKKAKRAKKAKAEEAEVEAVEAQASIETPEPEPQADGTPDELDADEEDELEGDWESGADDEDEDEDEDEQEKLPLPPARLERLQKILAAAGVASRRHAEELISEGRVQVNGKVVTELGTKADAARDHIRVDGKLLHGAERLRYFVLNKPRGYVTTVSDPEGRPTVMEFFAKTGERVYPVGRLDYLSEGLLLMTNDGDLANKLTKAASGVEKTYLVKVSGEPDEEMIDSLREGVSIDRGKPGEGRVRTAPARIQKVRQGDNPWFEVTLIEGRNRELRKMFEEIGHHVEKIRRVGYGPLVLDVEPGQSRELDDQELHLLQLAAAGKWKPRRVKGAAMLPKEAGRSVDHEAGKRGGRPFRDKRRPDSRPGTRSDSRPGRGFQERGGRSSERPAYGRGPERGQGTGFGGQDRGGARREFDRPRPPRTGDSRPGGFGGGFEGGQDRGQGSETTGQERRQGGGFQGRENRQGFGGQGRGQSRGAGSARTSEGRGFGRGPSRGPGRDQERGERPARPQGQRFGGDRPFRAKPEFQGERPRRGPSSGGGFQARPPRAGSQERPARSGFQERPPRPGFQDRPARPGKLHIEEEGAGRGEGRTQGRIDRGTDRGTDRASRGEFRPERPETGTRGREGRGGFGNRPPRPAGGGFRQDRGGDQRRGEFRGLGQQREDRRPPRAEGGGGRPEGRPGARPGSRPASGPKAGGRPGGRPEGRGGFDRGKGDQAGGRPRFGGGGRGGSGSGPRQGNRPGGRGGAGSGGARGGGSGRPPRRPR